jgi:hypothetical protein
MPLWPEWVMLSLGQQHKRHTAIGWVACTAQQQCPCNSTCSSVRGVHCSRSSTGRQPQVPQAGCNQPGHGGSPQTQGSGRAMMHNSVPYTAMWMANVLGIMLGRRAPC